MKELVRRWSVICDGLSPARHHVTKMARRKDEKENQMAELLDPP